MFKATKTLSDRDGGDQRSTGGTGVTAPVRATLDRLHLDLSHALESDVIPRLVESHRTDLPSPTDTLVVGSRPGIPPPATSPPSSPEVDPLVLELCRRLLLRDERAADDYVEQLVRDLLSPEAALLDVLAPAARHLGVLWSEDLCDFTDVTVGVWRLERILRRLADHPAVERRPARTSRRILLTPSPGEQHSFGLSMLAQFFRQAGWDVRRTNVEVGGSLCNAVRNEWFDVVGISASCARHVESIQSCVHDIRRVSRNRSIRILVGGSAFDECPDLATRVGADGYAADGLQAVTRAEALISIVSRSL